MSQHYLVTYAYIRGGVTSPQYACIIVEDVESEIESWQEFDDEGEHILINVHPVSAEFAEKWDGALMGM